MIGVWDDPISGGITAWKTQRSEGATFKKLKKDACLENPDTHRNRQKGREGHRYLRTANRSLKHWKDKEKTENPVSRITTLDKPIEGDLGESIRKRRGRSSSLGPQ